MDDDATADAVDERSGTSERVMIADIRNLRERLDGVLDRLTDADVTAPSRLPGWTRGHVLAHLAGVGSALARQLEHARAHRLVELYDGGRPGRDAAIEAGAGASAESHARAVRTAALRIEAALAGLGPTDWELPTRDRGGLVVTAVHAWWRELAVHLTDLDLGMTSEEWSPALLDHLVEHLAPSVPEGMLLVLVPGEDGASRWEIGAGDEVRVRGRASDLVAWLAGREPIGPVAAERAGAPTELPQLAPWP
jgi:maleylpyruvate isomerase